MTVSILTGDCRSVLTTLPDESVHCVVTSPPYFGLRDYGVAGQIGLEPTPDAFVAELVGVFRELRRVLRKDGTCWLNLGDSFAGSWGNQGRKEERGTQRAINGPMLQNLAPYPDKQKNTGKIPDGSRLKPKDLIGIPWAVAFALRDDGWWLRQDIIWAKPNPMPESVTDRCTKAHEYLFLLTKSATYYYDAAAIAEASESERDRGRPNGAATFAKFGHNTSCGTSKTRNRRSVWTVATQPFNEWGETVRRVRVAWDAPDDGKKRIASPDCLVHGGQDHRASNGSDDEHGDYHRPRTRGTDNRHALEQSVDCAPTVTPLELAIAQHSADLPNRSCSASATRRSNETRRTDPVPETSPSYTASAQIPSRTPDTSEEREPFGSADHTHASNSEQGGSGDHLSAQMAGRSVDNVSCSCGWYTEKTEKTSHFATFPPALIEPCILAGCPEKCCAKCGAPWVREVENTTSFEGGSGMAGRTAEQVNANGKWAGKQYGTNIKLGPVVSSRTLGFSPSCKCDAGTVPGTCLDPFGGAGTTGLVADRLQRNAILIELNESYARMSAERISRESGMFSNVEICPDGAGCTSTLPLNDTSDRASPNSQAHGTSNIDEALCDAH